MMRQSALRWWGLAALVGAALWPWRWMPIYPDEIALRLDSARALRDQGVGGGLWSLCGGARAVPDALWPGAWGLSQIDQLVSPAAARPLVLALVAICILLATRVVALERGTPPSGKMLIALVGVAGGGMSLLRPEAFLLLELGVGTFAWSACREAQLGAPARLALLVAMALTMQFAVIAHPEGLLLLPFGALILMALLRPWLGAFLSMLCGIVVAGVYAEAGHGLHAVSCSSYPQIQHFWQRMVFSESDLAAAGGVKAWVFQKLLAQWSNFTFADRYTIDYLPPLLGASPRIRAALNDAVGLMLGINFFLALLAMVRGLIGMRKLESWTGWMLPRRESRCASALLVVAIAGPAMLLMLVDVQNSFYRSVWVNFAFGLAVTLDEAARPVTARRSLALCARGAYMVMLVIVVVCSLLATMAWIEPLLRNGYSGPSISLRTDWATRAREAEQLERLVGGRDVPGKLVIDDLTYVGLRNLGSLQAITYLSVQSQLTGATIVQTMQRTGCRAVVARCDAMRDVKIPIAHQQGELCASSMQEIISLSNARKRLRSRDVTEPAP